MTTKHDLKDAVEELGEETDDFPPLSAVLKGEIELEEEGDDE